MTWSARPNLTAGARLLAERTDALLDQIDSLTSPGWTDWSATFALQAVTTNPTKGNSTYTARYRSPSGSDVVDFEWYILIGSTFSAGNGVYRFTVPFNANATAILCAVGGSYIFDNGTANRQGVVRFEAAGYVNVFLNGATAAITHAGSGTAWATGDIIAGSIRYQPA